MWRFLADVPDYRPDYRLGVFKKVFKGMHTNRINNVLSAATILFYTHFKRLD